MSIVLESFSRLGPISRSLHYELRNLFYLLLPIAFALALIINFFRAPSEGGRFVEVLRRAIIATLLLSAFEEITSAIMTISDFIAGRISDMSGLDELFNLASLKAKEYADNPTHSILAVTDLFVSALSFISLFFLTLVRVVMMSLYHFSWAFLCVVSPLLLLMNLFAPAITLGLFRTLMEISSWQIVWAVLSAMLKELPFAAAYNVQGGLFAVIIINVLIALFMILTPIVVRVLASSGLSSIASTAIPLAFPAVMRMAIPAMPASSLVSAVRRSFSTRERFSPNSRPTPGSRLTSPPKTKDSFMNNPKNGNSL